jgi:hypothetical protein
MCPTTCCAPSRQRLPPTLRTLMMTLRTLTRSCGWVVVGCYRRTSTSTHHRCCWLSQSHLHLHTIAVGGLLVVTVAHITDAHPHLHTYTIVDRLVPAGHASQRCESISRAPCVSVKRAVPCCCVHMCVVKRVRCCCVWLIDELVPIAFDSSGVLCANRRADAHCFVPTVDSCVSSRLLQVVVATHLLFHQL